MKPIDPQIVIRGIDGADANAALKAFIDEWFVPTLVEEYIRQLQRQSSLVACGDSNTGRKQGNGHER